MLHHIFDAAPKISKPATAVEIIGKRSRMVSVLQSAMTVAGVGAVTALAIMFFKPELTSHIHNVSPFSKGEPEVVQTVQVAFPTEQLAKPVEAKPIEKIVDKDANQKAVNQVAKQVDVKSAPISREQQSVTTWLSKRYRVAHDATNMLVTASYLTAKELNLDPLLILSVMAIESGLNPYAESPVGAQGLMQVMSKVHRDKFNNVGGLKAALNPTANIRVGAQILKEYVTRTGSVEGGLKMYVGAALTDNDGGYGGRVLAEYRRLKDVSNGKSVPTITPPATAKPATIQVSVPVTADKVEPTKETLTDAATISTTSTTKDNKSEAASTTAI